MKKNFVKKYFSGIFLIFLWTHPTYNVVLNPLLGSHISMFLDAVTSPSQREHVWKHARTHLCICVQFEIMLLKTLSILSVKFFYITGKFIQHINVVCICICVSWVSLSLSVRFSFLFRFLFLLTFPFSIAVLVCALVLFLHFHLYFFFSVFFFIFDFFLVFLFFFFFSFFPFSFLVLGFWFLVFGSWFLVRGFVENGMPTWWQSCPLLKIYPVCNAGYWFTISNEGIFVEFFLSWLGSPGSEKWKKNFESEFFWCSEVKKVIMLWKKHDFTPKNFFSKSFFPKIFRPVLIGSSQGGFRRFLAVRTKQKTVLTVRNGS